MTSIASVIRTTLHEHGMTDQVARKLGLLLAGRTLTLTRIEVEKHEVLDRDGEIEDLAPQDGDEGQRESLEYGFLTKEEAEGSAAALLDEAREYDEDSGGFKPDGHSWLIWRWDGEAGVRWEDGPAETEKTLHIAEGNGADPALVEAWSLLVENRNRQRANAEESCGAAHQTWGRWPVPRCIEPYANPNAWAAEDEALAFLLERKVPVRSAKHAIAERDWWLSMARWHVKRGIMDDCANAARQMACAFQSYCSAHLCSASTYRASTAVAAVPLARSARAIATAILTGQASLDIATIRANAEKAPLRWLATVTGRIAYPFGNPLSVQDALAEPLW